MRVEETRSEPVWLDVALSSAPKRFTANLEGEGRLCANAAARARLGGRVRSVGVSKNESLMNLRVNRCVSAG